ncbi:Asp23/Gls24 family envelope stress response protein [Streptomyces sp. NPDC058525]|uniref:Asp23/Gls24 family envelope stress response protein n=1 Tax=Streptomyces sp. NPDC058525 TaxID=3346538 RepID=UPI003659A067
MTTPQVAAVSAAVTEAVLAVPGVACLRPGLRGLLHSVVSRPEARTAATGGERSAVRVTLGAAGSVTAVHIDIVARAQHRAADVARAVRAAAAETAAASPAAVKVTVTGIV